VHFLSCSALLGAGGPRALAVAARSLLANNPILQHPGAPCHSLLTQLAGMQGSLNSGPATSAQAQAEGSFISAAGAEGVSALGSSIPETAAADGSSSSGACASPTESIPGRTPASPSMAPGDLPARARPTGAGGIASLDKRMVRQQSSEALEVLSSQFFSG